MCLWLACKMLRTILRVWAVCGHLQHAQKPCAYVTCSSEAVGSFVHVPKGVKYAPVSMCCNQRSACFLFVRSGDSRVRLLQE